jgi:hypothetical protein
VAGKRRPAKGAVMPGASIEIHETTALRLVWETVADPNASGEDLNRAAARLLLVRALGDDVAVRELVEAMGAISTAAKTAPKKEDLDDMLTSFFQAEPPARGKT